MNPAQVIQESFARVAPIAPPAAAMFCCRPFEIAPDVKPFFHGEMTDRALSR